MFSVKTFTVVSGEIDGLNFEAQNVPLDWMNQHSERVGDKLILGYVADDTEPMHPLEDCDGNGRIYRRDGLKNEHSEIRDALGLDQYDSLDLDRVCEYPDRFKKEWVLAAFCDPEFQAWCKENGRPPLSDDPEKMSRYFFDKARRFWNKTEGCERIIRGFEDSIFMFSFTDKVMEKLFQELRIEGEIGNRDVVLLDVYEHSGVAYSVSGEGMQCAFDTSRGGAIWVPDESASQEIERRAEVYQFGELSSRTADGVELYKFRVDSTGEETEECKQWHECFEAASGMVKSLESGDGFKGRRRAAVELAREAAELYTDFCNGSVYEINVEVHKLIEGEDKETDLEDSFNENGLFGFAAAESELKAEFERVVSEEKKKLADSVRH